MADGDGPGRQVPGRPQQQHQLPHLLPGWQPVQIGPPLNIHLRRVRHASGVMIGLTPKELNVLEVNHNQIRSGCSLLMFKYNVYYYYISIIPTLNFRKIVFEKILKNNPPGY